MFPNFPAPPAPPVFTASAVGLYLPDADAAPVPVVFEVELLRRLPACSFVGLTGPAAREQAERVRSAITAAGFEMPRCRIVVAYDLGDGVRVSRADFTACDLPIALAILEASGQIKPRKPGAPFVGSLALDGACSLPAWPVVIGGRTAPTLRTAAR